MKMLLACLFALLPLSVVAQPIYGSPQKAAYASPAEYPFLEGQCWWRAPGVNTVGEPAHMHVIAPDFPLYGVHLTREPFTVPMALTLNNAAGKITRIGGIRLKSITLDQLPGGTPVVLQARDGVVVLPVPLIGNPSGTATWTGTATFDPAAIAAQPLRGWMAYSLIPTLVFDNRDKLYTTARAPRYALIDPTAPETGSGNIVNANCQIEDASDPLVGRWGQQFTEFVNQVLPVLGPVSPELPWAPKAIMYNYATAVTGLPERALPERGIGELWLDPDIHNGNPGTLLQRVIGADNSRSDAAITHSLPSGIPDGPHNLLYLWRRSHGVKELTSLFRFRITVGPGGVAPPSGTPVPPPPPPPGPDPCVVDPLTAVITFPVDPNVTKAVITQVGRNCPAIEVPR